MDESAGTTAADLTDNGNHGVLGGGAAAQQPGWVSFPTGHAVTVRVEDGRGGDAAQNFTLTAGAGTVNRAPTISSTPRTATRLGSSYMYVVAAADLDGDPLTYHLGTAPAGMAIDLGGLITWDPTAIQLGDHLVAVRVEDGRGGGDTQNFTLTVATQYSNRSPVITSNPPPTATAGQIYRYDATGADPDGDLVVWSLDRGPAGLSIDATRGSARWTPAFDQLGTHEVALRLTDALGGSSTQTFNLTVRAVNLPPVISSIPPVAAMVGRSYTYVVRANDPDGDPLTFRLATAPEGMTIGPATGFITWTPAVNQAGGQQVVVQVEDGRGWVGVQTYTILVATTPPNRPPIFTSTPQYVATDGQLYQYTAVAVDPDGDPLSFSLREAPAGMTIDPATGLVRWTPTAAQSGVHTVTVLATDPGGARGGQQFSLLVTVNTPPVIALTPPPPVAATLGAHYYYDVRATDAEQQPVTYSLIQSPTGMAIDDLGRISWNPVATQLGSHTVDVRVDDPLGQFDSLSFQITITDDTRGPTVNLQLSANPAAINTAVTFLVNATDDVGVVSRELTVDAVPVLLDSTGRATLTMGAAGTFSVVASARDAAGNSGTATVTLAVIDPSDETGPEVALTGPAEGAVLTAWTDVVGTARDDTLQFYTLSIAPLGSDAFVEFARGTASVTDDVLGRLDPSLLANDSYVLRLLATDAGGNESLVERDFHVAGDLKLGNFTLSFTDLTVPVFGIPITVSRTYDTLTATQSGDFGFGWRLGLRDMNLRTSVTPTGFEKDGFFNPLKVGSRVYVTVPGGTREAFTFQPALAAGIRGGFLGIFEPKFVADPGVKSSLTVTAADLRISADGRMFDYATGIPYNPASTLFGGAYLLTTKEGVAFDINGETGQLRKLVDPNNNILTFTATGISGPKGVTVAFERDAQRRITSVVDPTGQRIRYQYDASGNLVAVTDRMNNATQFEYRSAPAHYLAQVIDPLGRTGVRTEYDAQGRMARVVDAAGNAIQITYDVANSLETIKDQLGNPMIFEYDGRGNVVQQIDALGGITRRVYDANNNMLTKTDPLGRTTAYTYDDRGDVLTRTDALGNTTISTHQSFTFGTTALAASRGRAAPPFTRVRTSTDALGNTTAFGYDFYGNYLSSTDSAGRATTVTYDRFGDPASITDANGNTTQFDYADGHLLRQIDPLGNATTFTYDANGNQLTSTTTLTAADGTVRTVTTATDYDAQGRLVAVTDAEGGVTRTEYDAAGNKNVTIDVLGRRTEYRYDERNLLSERILPDDTPADPSDNPRTKSEYDAAGRETARIDELGRRTEYEHDKLGRLVKTTNSDRTLTQTEYDAAGQVTVLVDELGNRTELEYDANGQETVRRDALGNATFSTYDAAGRSVSVTDALGHTTAFVHDAVGRLIETHKADGTKSQTTFDASGRVIARTDALGETTRYEHDAVGHVTAIIDALEHATTFTYDEDGHQLTLATTVTTADGTVHTLTSRTDYDGLGRVVAITDAEGGVTRMEYDAAGNWTATNDPLGRRTEYRFDDRDRLIETVFADATPADPSDNPRTRIEYDDAGQETARIDELGRRTEYEYDGLSRLVKTIYADGAVRQIEYDATGQVTAQIDERGNRTEFEYDANGRRTVTRDALGNSRISTYDAAGRKIAETDALGHTTQVVYDAVGHLTQTDYADGAKISSSYDARGLEIARTDQLGRTTRYEYDALSRVTAVVDALNQRTEYTYDEVGDLTRQQDATGDVVRYEYDNLGRRTATVLPLGQRSVTTYDVVGNVTASTDFNGATITLAYDANDRLTSKTLPDDASVTYTYLSNGLLSTVTDARGATTYAYDNRDRLLSRTDPDGALASYLYDAVGNRTSVTASVGGTSLTTSYTFDVLNRFASVADPDLGVTSYTYDAVGNLVRTERPNGTVEARSYDDLNRLLLVEDAGPSGVISGHSYTLSPTGRRDAVVEHDGRRVDYTYDVLDRLLREAITDAVFGDRTFDYTYDAAGNRLTRDDSADGLTEYTYDANDRLLTETLTGALTEYIYDNNGNMLARVSSTDQVFYNWDFEDRLIEADTNGDGITDVQNVYDDNGVRVSQTVGGEETRFLIDTLQPFAQVLLEYRPSGLIAASYVYGNRLISQSRGGVKSFYHSDGLGSTRALTDAAGLVLSRYFYDAFGRLLQQSGSTANSYLFAGQQRDAALGLDYLRARYYDPSLGRFTAADPLRGTFPDPNRLHVYAYGKNDPVNQIDPSGTNFLLSERAVAAYILGTLGAIQGGIEGGFKGAVKGFAVGALIGIATGGLGAFSLVPRAGGVLPGGAIGLEAVAGESIIGSLGLLGLLGAAAGVHLAITTDDDAVRKSAIVGLIFYGAAAGLGLVLGRTGSSKVSGAVSESDKKLVQLVAGEAEVKLNGTALGSQAENINVLFQGKPGADIRNLSARPGLSSANVVDHLNFHMRAPRKIIVLSRSQTEAPGALDYIEQQTRFSKPSTPGINSYGPFGVIEIWAQDGNGFLERVRIYGQYPNGPKPPGSVITGTSGPSLNPPRPTGPPPANPFADTRPAEGQTAP